jgi:hypothetical protein
LPTNDTNSKEAWNISQIPALIAHQLSGFAQGEGSFYVAVKKRTKDRRLGVQLLPGFNVSNKDDKVLTCFKTNFNCGKLRPAKRVAATVSPEFKFQTEKFRMFEVNDLESLLNIVIPFYQLYRFIAHKSQNDFGLFTQCIDIIEQGKDQVNGITFPQVLKVLSLRNQQLSSKSKRGLNDKEILTLIKTHLENRSNTDRLSNRNVKLEQLEIRQVTQALDFLTSQNKEFWTYTSWDHLDTFSEPVDSTD